MSFFIHLLAAQSLGPSAAFDFLLTMHAVLDMLQSIVCAEHEVATSTTQKVSMTQIETRKIPKDQCPTGPLVCSLLLRNTNESLPMIAPFHCNNSLVLSQDRIQGNNVYQTPSCFVGVVVDCFKATRQQRTEGCLRVGWQRFVARVRL